MSTGLLPAPLGPHQHAASRWGSRSGRPDPGEDTLRPATPTPNSSIRSITADVGRVIILVHPIGLPLQLLMS